jgi:hypothetical protein
MPFAVAGPVLGAVAGAGVSSALGPSSQASGGGSNLYTPTGLGTADQTWQGLLGSEYNNYNLANLSQYGQQSLDQGLANQSIYTPMLTQGAYNASGALGTLGQQLGGASGTEFNAANQIYNTAFDPQSALFNQLSNQQQQQSGATNSMYGLGSSGVGAGIANQNQQNFDINWQNQQLGRQTQGLQAIGQAYGQAGQLGQAGAQATLQGSQLPYQIAQGLAAAPGQLGNTYGQFLQSNVYNPAQGMESQIIPYLNYGQGATSNAYNAASNSAGALGSAVSQGIGGLGTSLQNAGGFANLFGGTTGSFGGGNFSGAFNSNPYYSGGGNSYGFTS